MIIIKAEEIKSRVTHEMIDEIFNSKDHLLPYCFRIAGVKKCSLADAVYEVVMHFKDSNEDYTLLVR